MHAQANAAIPAARTAGGARWRAQAEASHPGDAMSLARFRRLLAAVGVGPFTGGGGAR